MLRGDPIFSYSIHVLFCTVSHVVEQIIFIVHVRIAGDEMPADPVSQVGLLSFLASSRACYIRLRKYGVLRPLIVCRQNFQVIFHRQKPLWPPQFLA